MSYSIASRIKQIRIDCKKTQEEIADVLGTSRQRYSRLENGQIDISYVVIKKISEYLGVSISEILKEENDQKELVTLFREKSLSENNISSVRKIEEILRVFKAHEKLYHQTRGRKSDDFW